MKVQPNKRPTVVPRQVCSQGIVCIKVVLLSVWLVCYKHLQVKLIEIYTLANYFQHNKKPSQFSLTNCSNNQTHLLPEQFNHGARLDNHRMAKPMKAGFPRQHSLNTGEITNAWHVDSWQSSPHSSSVHGKPS